MDPITLIVTALATGAVAGLKPTAEKVIKDAYEGLKTIIVDKYKRAQATVPVLEQDPASDAGKAVVREALTKEGAGEDEELLTRAQAVLEAIRSRGEAARAAEAAGVTIEDIEAGADVNIRRIVTSGPFTTKRVKPPGGVNITDITSGTGARAGEGGRPDG